MCSFTHQSVSSLVTVHLGRSKDDVCGWDQWKFWHPLNIWLICSILGCIYPWLFFRYLSVIYVSEVSQSPINLFGWWQKKHVNAIRTCKHVFRKNKCKYINSGLFLYKEVKTAKSLSPTGYIWGSNRDMVWLLDYRCRQREHCSQSLSEGLWQTEVKVLNIAYITLVCPMALSVHHRFIPEGWIHSGGQSNEALGDRHAETVKVQILECTELQHGDDTLTERSPSEEDLN